MINEMILHGRLVKDPELRYTQSKGLAVCSFTVAWSERFSQRDTKLFLNCTAWGKTAETVNKYFKKGQEIIVVGKLAMHNWTDKNGNARQQIQMESVENVHFCGPKQDSYESMTGGESSDDDNFTEMVNDEDELPFN